MIVCNESRIIQAGLGMDGKNNAFQILKFNHPGQIVREMPVYFLEYQGVGHQGYTGGGHNCPIGTRWVDIWGTEWHKEIEGVMGFPRGNPLASVTQLKKYHWPEPEDERICGLIYKMAKEFQGGDLFLGGINTDTLWEKAYMLVGMENMMVYFYTEPDFAREILHQIMNFQLGIAAHYLKLGVEYVLFGDDLGTQCGLLLSPHIISQFLLPEYRRLFKLYKEHKVIIEFHSCGHIQPLLDMFMDLGVDILNPLQATANNLDFIHAKTKNRMALHGGISSSILMDGPIEKIELEVRERILQLGISGGYFCDADQALPFPLEHIEALASAVQKYGCYPLS